MTEIRPIARTSTTNRGSDKVSVWIRTTGRSAEFASNGPFTVSGEDGLISEVSSMLQQAKQTISLTATKIDATFSQQIIEAAGKGVRVYLLLSDDGFDDWLKGGDSELAEHVLCRRSTQALPSLILTDSETKDAKGILMCSGTALDRSLKIKESSWGMELNKEQASQLAHHVSWLFWSANGARSETRCSDHLKSPQDVTPFRASLVGIPSSEHVSIRAKDEGKVVLAGIEDVENFSAIGFSAFDLRDIGGIEVDRRLDCAILTEPGQVRSGEVCADSCARELSVVVSAGGSSGWIFDWIPDATSQADHQAALRLDGKQSKAFNSLISNVQADSEWNLMNDVGISSLKVGSEARLSDGSTAAEIVKSQPIDLGPQVVTPWDQQRLADFEPHPASKPEPEPLAKSVKWTWTNLPPCPPSDAKPDLIERQYSDAISKAKKAEEYIEERLLTHKKKGEKAMKKLVKVKEKIPDDPREENQLKTWCSALKDAEAALKKLEDEGDSDIDRKKKTIGVVVPDAPGGNRPSVGSLLSHNKDLYLAIDSWDDFESGSTEADKFNAELCVTREVQNRKSE